MQINSDLKKGICHCWIYFNYPNRSLMYFKLRFVLPLNMDISNSYMINCFGYKTLFHKLQQNSKSVIRKEIF
jgi:hypothetical protein